MSGSRVPSGYRRTWPLSPACSGLTGHLRTGRKPLLSVGNADGEVQMLTTARFTILIHHDDANREFAYDVGAEKALAAAEPRTRCG
jgi:hypothetical protein